MTELRLAQPRFWRMSRALEEEMERKERPLVGKKHASQHAAMQPTQPAGEHADPAAVATRKGRSPMRPGLIAAIFAAAVVLIGGFIWYNNTQAENARLEQQQSEQAAQIAREEDAARQQEESAAAEQAAREEDAARQQEEIAAAEQAAREEEDAARQQEESAAAEQAARDAEEAEGVAETDAAGAVDEAQMADDDLIVVGDEITEGMIVVESATEEPTILSADDTATSTEIINDAETDMTQDSEANTETDTTTIVGSPMEPGQLLTPENFDHDEVLVLIETTEQISAEERSTLRALVEGVSANPAMLEATIESIRTALDLPSLDD